MLNPTGEPCRIRPGLSGALMLKSSGRSKQFMRLADGLYALDLKRDEEAVLYSGD